MGVLALTPIALAATVFFPCAWYVWRIYREVSR